MSSIARTTWPTIEAHRGDSANAPENTLAAFRRAIRLGASWIELDVHASRDGEIVVMHDANVERTTDGSGVLSDLPLAEIRALDAGAWFNPAFAGECVPLLHEVAALVRGTATRLNVEIKAGAGARVPEQQLVSILCATPGSSRHLVSSFSLEALLRVRAAASHMQLALIGRGSEILAAAVEHGLPWIHAHYRTVSLDLVAAAHAAGIRVNIWTLDKPELCAHYTRLGVDKICSNCPSRLLAATRL